MPALFIGRFQPFHLGHLDAIQQSLKQTDMLFIGIGSANENFQPQNPFTTGERIEMIKSALDEAKIPAKKYLIVPIPNINNYELWPHHVEQYLPPFDTIFTCSDIVAALFKNANSIRKKPWKIIRPKENLKINSTGVRAEMLKNKNWGKMVPKSVQKLLKSWKAPERIKAIQEAKK